MTSEKRIIVGASGASGFPVLIRCLQLLREAENIRTGLILTDSAVLTLAQETPLNRQALEEMADEVFPVENIGAGPASGSYRADGMLIAPCSMKTLAGIHSGYTDNLLLRAADVTLKEGRPLVLGVRETPLSAIHLRNMYELSMVQGVRIIPLMMSFYHQPDTIDEMVCHMAAKLVEPFGVNARDYQRWEGL